MRIRSDRKRRSAIAFRYERKPDGSGRCSRSVEPSTRRALGRCCSARFSRFANAVLFIFQTIGRRRFGNCRRKRQAQREWKEFAGFCFDLRSTACRRRRQSLWIKHCRGSEWRPVRNAWRAGRTGLGARSVQPQRHNRQDCA